MPALSLTDHGNLYGAIQFYQQAQGAGIKPLLGLEAYIAPGSRLEKRKTATGPRSGSYHITLLAMNREGFRNLVRMSSRAFLEGFYRHPRIDKELLTQYNEGIICLSGCASSELSRLVQSRAMEEAEEVAAWYRELFGDRYYIEVQNNGLPIQHDSTVGCVEIAKKLDIPVVATSDVHYVNREDAAAQDLLLCINTKKFISDQDRMRMDTDEFYLRSPEEMYASFPDMPDAVERSVEIADRIDIDLQLGQRHFPVYTPPEGKDSEDYLRELCIEGLKERYEGDTRRLSPEGVLSDEVMARLDRELDVISRQGYPNYFLIVWDFVRFAREREIHATARGSGVGSLVCFALYMSHVCPLEYDLLFERFLDVSRTEAPDIDIDFEQERRSEVLQYVKSTYGLENVAQIGTFGTMATKQAVNDSGRALGLSIDRVKQIGKVIPEGPPLAKSSAEDPMLKEAMDKDPEVRELVDAASSVEGLVRNVGTHACAVVIANQPLMEYVPLQHISGKEDVVTQWEGPDVECAGLLKMDFLGLRNLSILSRVITLIEQTTGEVIDPYRLPLDDKETYALLCRGETKGIFQLESGGIRDLLQQMRPDHFRDIIATSALYRPGPLEGGMVKTYVEVKNGRAEAVYHHPIMEEVLEETHGVMVYQEQVMRILNRLGEIELPDSYKCIKAISKKKYDIIANFRKQFVENSVKAGLSADRAEELFGMIEKFAGYGFNKSHSTAYALIAYMTAYLKAHYPVEFMAALLSSDIPRRNFETKDPLAEHLDDCRRMEITIVPVDVNRSDVEFTVDHSRIIFGLAAVKTCVGGAAPRAIVAEREARGPFRDIFDFCERLDSGSVNRKTIESLIKAGAMDSFGASRAQLIEVLERAMKAGSARASDRQLGQMSLFDLTEEEPEPVELPDVPDWTDRELLREEKSVLGFYQTCHPLDEHSDLLRQYCSHSCVEATELTHQKVVLLGGLISGIKHSSVKKPKPGQPSRFASFDLEDHSGIMRCNLWPRVYEQFAQFVKSDEIVVVRGSIDRRDEGDKANLSVMEITTIDNLDSQYADGLRLCIDEAPDGEEKLKQLQQILRGYPGECYVGLRIRLKDGVEVACRCRKIRVDVQPELRERVKQLLGAQNVEIITRSLGEVEKPKRRWPKKKPA